MTKLVELIKAISLLLIPLVIAGGGWMIQKSIQNSNLDRDYVQIAISILQDKDSSEGLRTWATEILNKKSPVPLQNSLASEFIKGSSLLPEVISNSNASLQVYVDQKTGRLTITPVQ
jgi:hypothetical protein